jgi:two-component system chemotaxis response regulator CheB
MVVDDSPLIRKIASDILDSDPGIKVVATAASGEFALQKLERFHPDVITMDIEMPGMGGLRTIREIMLRRPLPILVLSAFARRGAELSLQALEYGAVDFMLKPTTSLSGGIDDIARGLIERIKAAGGLKGRSPVAAPLDCAIRREPICRPKQPAEPANKVFELVAIGASTGGPVALKRVLSSLPADFPPAVLVVQHMPPIFTTAFAERLNSVCALTVKEAEHGDPVIPGRVLIAAGNHHMRVRRNGVDAHVLLDQREPVWGHRPSVDVLMQSVAEQYGADAIGVIMTGMGKDGAAGIRELHEKGGFILAQDRESSVIFGMNGEVVRSGEADEVVSLAGIADRLLERAGGNSTALLGNA